ncbi:MAG: hypothetical protein ACE5R6_13735 [Candidatus Heimdallarchaeota archaeon]
MKSISQVVKEKILLETLQTYYIKGWSYYGLPELLDGLWSMSEIEAYMREHNYPKRTELQDFTSTLQQIRQKIVGLKKILEDSDLQTLDELPQQIVKHFLKLKEEQLRKERVLLEALLKYYKGGENQTELLIHTRGEWNAEEISSYMEERGYPSSIQSPDHLALQQRVLMEIAQIEKQQLKFGFDIERTLTGILVIPSWRKLIGTEFTGFFKQTLVRSIERDSVVMVVDLGRGFQEVTGEDLFLITGPGIYFTEFNLGTELPIQDHREITGIILPRSIYQAIQQAEPIYRSEKIRATITDLAAFIPFSMVTQPYPIQAYLRGVLMRSIFSPHRDILTLLAQNCKTNRAYSVDEGFKVLSASSIHFNRLLVESKFLLTANSQEYMQLTAGLANIQPGLENIIVDLFPTEEAQQVLGRINSLKEYYAEFGELLLFNWIPDWERATTNP